MVARLWYGQIVALCVFDLDHTLIQTPLDLAAMAVFVLAEQNHPLICVDWAESGMWKHLFGEVNGFES